MKRELGGIYNLISFEDEPEYKVIEFRSMAGEFQYCVVDWTNSVISARTNWFASFREELTLKDVKDCVFLPGKALIEHLRGGNGVDFIDEHEVLNNE